MHAKNFHHTGFNKWKAPVILFRQAFERIWSGAEFKSEWLFSDAACLYAFYSSVQPNPLCSIHFLNNSPLYEKKNKHYLSYKVFVHLLWFRLRVLAHRQRNYAYLKNKKGWESEKVKQFLRRCLAPGNKRILKNVKANPHRCSRTFF